MALESVVTYAVALGLPLWLVIEELVHRSASSEPMRAAARPRLHRAEIVGPETA